MVKKLKVFQALEDLFAHNVDIYTGPTYRVYANEFTLVKNNLRVKKKEEVARKNDLYYRSGLNFINIENNCVLPKREEAVDYCNRVIKSKNQKITELLRNPNATPKEVNRYLEEVKIDSCCIYADNSEIHYSHSMPGKEFKKILKNSNLDNENKK